MNMNSSQMASLFSNRLSSAYNQLRGDLGAPQTATETVDKLVEKIQVSPAVEDRRTAVLGLKGLSRDWKEEVGNRGLTSLLAVLQHDAPYDVDIAKATLETLMQLCEVPEKPAKDDLGLRFTDQFLETPQPLHSLLALLSLSPSFYPRFYTLQYLSQLLTTRPTVAQSYLMSAPPPGLDGILSVLDPSTPAQPAAGPSSVGGGGAIEMLRNEALLLCPALLAGNADLQKIVAFSGAFEKLFQIIEQEGGADGGIVVQDALTVVGGLLRFNVSNQNYFRELSLIPSLPPILGFQPSTPPDAVSSDEFALQYWPEQKIYNAGLVLGLIRMLMGGPGGPNQTAMASSGVTRCLLEIALASNAPKALKAQALNTLTPILSSSLQNQNLLSTLTLAPLVAVHADEQNPNGGFVRLSPQPAVVGLISSVVDGDPSVGGRGLRGRAAGVNLFEAYVSDNDDARIGILSSMIAPPADNPNAEFPNPPQSAGSIILSGLLDLPAQPGAQFDPYRSLFASLLLAHLVRNSEHGKKLARETTLPSGDADGGDSAIAEDDEKISLVQLVVGNLMMASREHQECVNRAARDGKISGSTEEEDWTRVMVGYLVLLCTWLWDSPKTVKEFLSESANLQVLIQPITQTTGIDPLVQGLSAFLLGVCYEFNREPGEITRSTLHPILHSRIGPDQFVSRMARLREDARFKAVQPDAFDVEGGGGAPEVMVEDDGELDEGLELWFDWAFVDFWKNHYYTIQRSIAVDPDAVRSTAAQDDGETAAIIMSLRQKLKAQTDEVVQLQSKLSSLTATHQKEKDTLVEEVQSLSTQVAALTASHTEHQSLSSAQVGELESLRKDLDDVRQKLSSSAGDTEALLNVREELTKSKADYEEATESHSRAIQEKDERISVVESELALAKAVVASSSKKGKGKSGAGGGPGADTEKVAALEKELEEEKKQKAENEKEHEDLLVLLEELSQKRKRDKAKLKELGGEVSEAEDEDEDEDEEAGADEAE